MEKTIAYIDDAGYARQQLVAAEGAPPAGAASTHWVLVACAPRLTHRIGKWLSHSARENWREKWAEKLFLQVVPALQAQGHTVTTVVARRPLTEVTRQLVAEHGTRRVVDARRPKLGHDLPPLEDKPPRPGPAAPGLLAGLGALVLLSAE